MRDIFSLPAYRSRVRNRAWRGMAVGGVALALAACPGPVSKPPQAPGILAREVAAGVARSGQVDQTLAVSIRALSGPPVEAQLEGLAVFAGFLALADPDAEALDLGSCVPMLDADADADADEDGYPRVKTTQTIACQLAVIQVQGTLKLLDEDDMDPASGFNSELDYQVTVGLEGEPLVSATGDLALWVSSMGAAGYDVYYRGKMAGSDQLAEHKSRLLYAGTLSGSFAAGSLALDGSLAFSSNPVDCTSLPEPDRAACQEQMPEGDAPSEVQLAVSSTGIEYDTASCATILTGGHVDVRDAAGNVLRISYDGCDQRSVTYNGEALSLTEES